MREDRVLSSLYAVAAVSNVVSLVCISIAWGYWHRTLNVCLDTDCGCILFGSWTFGAFYGGDGAMCGYSCFSTIPVILWSALMFFYHMCFPPKTKPEIIDVRLSKFTLIRDNGGKHRIIKVSKTRKLYLPAVVGLILSILIFVGVVILWHGFNVTCREYKKSVIDELNATGNLAMAVYDRLSCHSVYDLMDYLIPDPPSLALKYRRGSWLINTGSLLITAIISNWISLITFALITYISFCLSISGKLLKPT